MIKQTKTGINRRKLISNAAKGAVAAAGAISGLTLGSVAGAAGRRPMASNGADAYWTKARTERYLCAQNHAAKSVELGNIMSSPKLDNAEKNLALRTARCPKCNVTIAPTLQAA